MTTINANTLGINISYDTSNTLQIQTNTSNCLLISYDSISNFTTANFNSTSAIVIPTPAVLPSSPTLGMLRYDNANAHILVYKSTGWAIFI